jgi:hypothetical protein
VLLNRIVKVEQLTLRLFSNAMFGNEAIGLATCLGAILLIAASICYADDNPGSIGPRIEVDRMMAEAPESFNWIPVSANFRLRNTGDAPLDLKVTKTSCGCVVYEMTKNQLAPGEDENVSVGYKPKPENLKVGNQEFSANIETNDPKQTAISLSVKVKLYPTISVEPSPIKLGKMDDGVTGAEFYVVTAGDGALPKVNSVKSSSQNLSVRPLGEEKRTGICKAKYEAVLDTQALNSEFNDVITVESDSEKTPIIEVPVSASIESPLKSNPASIVFESNEVEKKITLSKKGGDASIAEPLSATLDNSVLQASTVANPNGWEVDVKLDAAKAFKAFDALLEVKDANGKRLSRTPVHVAIRNVNQPQKDSTKDLTSAWIIGAGVGACAVICGLFLFIKRMFLVSS